ncbi:MAG: C39 family peptidase [Thermodesulfobacteriota bacterium]
MSKINGLNTLTRVPKRFSLYWLNWLIPIFLLLSSSIGSLSSVQAQTARKSPAPAPGLERIPVSRSQVRTNDYYSIQKIVFFEGNTLNEHMIKGPPKPPPGYALDRMVVTPPESNRILGIKTLTVPAFDWVFGCAAVSGAMIAGFYDRTDFPNIYTGPTNGGVTPLNNSSWPTWSDGINTYPSLPLAASRQGIDGRTTGGSIDNYWLEFLSDAEDPYLTNGWTEHPWGEAIGDYMKVSQSAYGNIDGGATIHYWDSSAEPFSCEEMVSYAVHSHDLTYGIKLFYEARGYSVTDCYNQRTDNTVAGGFSFARYKAEIDADRPVLLILEGHAMVGVGYDDTGNTVYLHDTWDHNMHSMTWGGSYSGMELMAVSIVNPQTTPPVTTPTVTTDAASGITTSGGILNGTVNPNNGATLVSFEYGLTTAYGTVVTADQSPITGNSNIPVSRTISGLTPNTTYHFRVVGANSAGTTYGEDLPFNTEADITPPSLHIISHSNGQHLTSGTVTLNGTATDSGNGDSGIQQVTVNGVRAEDDTTAGSGTANWSKLLSLNPGVNTLTVMAYDNSSHQNVNVVGLTIYYDSFQIPTVFSGPATNQTAQSVTLRGTVIPNGSLTTCFFEWGPTAAYGNATVAQSCGSGWEPVAVTADLAGLVPHTNYHYRLAAANSLGPAYGEDRTFLASLKTLPWLMLLLGD